MVVVDEYLLSRQDGNFVQAGRKRLRTGAVITRAYADEKNADKRHPRFFVIHEDATAEYYANGAKVMAQRKINAQKDKVSASDIAGALLQATKDQAGAERNPDFVKTDNTNKPVVEAGSKKPEGKPNNKWEVPQIKEWLDKKGIKYHHMLGKKKLLIKCNEV